MTIKKVFDVDMGYIAFDENVIIIIVQTLLFNVQVSFILFIEFKFSTRTTGTAQVG